MDFVIHLNEETMKDTNAWNTVLAELNLSPAAMETKDIYLRVDDVRLEF